MTVMGPDAGTAHITVKPSLKGWSAEVRRQLAKEFPGGGPKIPLVPDNPQGSGEKAGEKFAGGFDRTVRRRVTAALKALPPAEIGVASNAAEQKIKDLRAQLTTLSEKRLSVDIDTGEALAELEAVRVELNRLSDESVNIDVKADTLLAATQLAAIRKQVEELDRSNARVNASAGGLGGATSGSGLLSFLSGATSRAGALTSAILAVAAAAVPMGAALVAAASAAAAALTAAAAGVGVLAGALLGNILPVLQAQKDLEQQQKSAETAARGLASAQQQVAAAGQAVADAERSAARSVADAQRALADARRQAAASVASAEDQVATAQQNAVTAQDALTDARDAARQKLADYESQLRAAALAESGAALSVTAAQERLNEVLADPASSQLAIEQARQTLKEAQASYGEAQKSRDDLQRQAKKDRAAGVEGDSAVVAAKDALRDANQDLADSEAALGDARADAARQVAAAQRTLDRARADGARAVARADQQLAQARDAAAVASADYADAQAELAGSMAAMTGPAAVFVTALDRAKGAWRDFTDATAVPVFGLAAQALDLFSDVLPDLVPLVAAAADGVSTLLSDLSDFAGSATGRRFLDWLTGSTSGAIVSIGRFFGNIAVGLGGLVGALADVDTGFGDLAGSFADFGRTAGQNPQVQEFLAYAAESLPIVGRFIGSVVSGFSGLARALAPVGDLLLVRLTDAFNAIGDMDPSTIGIMAAIAGAIGVWAGVPIAAPVAITGALIAISQLVQDSPALQSALAPLTEIFSGAYDAISDFAGLLSGEYRRAWKRWQPELEDLATILSDDLQPAFEEFWPAVRPILKGLAHLSGDQLSVNLGIGITALELLSTTLADVLNLVSGTFQGDWGKAFRSLADLVSGPFGGIGGVIDAKLLGELADLKTTFKDIADWWADHLWRGSDALLPRLEDAFRTAVDAITDIWSDLQAAAADPIKFMVETVYNKGLVPVINALPGVDSVDTVSTAGWEYATGGVLPGYTPGRDVHTFTSPTGGRLALSGGEAVMRPEWTRLMGGSRAVDLLNRAARRGRDALGATLAAITTGSDLGMFAGGGVIGRPDLLNRTVWPTTFTSLSPQYPGHTGIDISIPGTADYGLPVFAAHAGTARAYDFGADSYGKSVWVTGTDGFTTIYGHLSAIAEGLGRVMAGQQIGNIGSTGNSTGPHLHFEVRPGGTPEAALAYLNGSPLPFGGTTGGGGTSSSLAGALSAVASMVRDVPDWFSRLRSFGDWGTMMAKVLRATGGQFADWVNDRIPGPGPIPAVFDAGGVATGTGWLRKDTIAPERVLSPAQTAAFEDLVAALDGWGRGLGATALGSAGDRAFRLESGALRVIDWEKGLVEIEGLATDAAETVLGNQYDHDARMSAMDLG
ncbi:peptidoglycan DD-metalloendopeptidase family protein [Nocardioides bruguierae]|uniref:peptidoglycan DD-metalloendopeptidase family protein n=1 Tax=Nocardioides bruguierae TaxID=2945102 RepID=UPI002547B12B|nr:peptidoglycan DD-metalloendopeptidase family protein [Nocardioides bruguierae]